MSFRVWYTFLLAVLLSLPGLSLADYPELERLRERIEGQYSAIDANMLMQPYQVSTLLVRPDRENIREFSTFRPERPSGEKERLETVNDGPPTARDQRRFDLRPQPDQRDSQSIRLDIDYQSLTITDLSYTRVYLQFQPVLRINGNIDENGRRFTGHVIYNRETDDLQQVTMTQTSAFSRLFFNVNRFNVEETFHRVDGRLLRHTYYHDMDAGNRLIDLVNETTMLFSYQDEWAAASNP